MRKVNKNWKQSFRDMKPGETVVCPLENNASIRATAYSLNIEYTGKKVYSVHTDRKKRRVTVTLNE